MKKRWMLIGTIVSVATIFIACLVAFKFLSTPNEMPEQREISDVTLPAEGTVSTPIMYDIVNGTLGLSENYVDMVAGGKVFIASKPNSATCYVSYLGSNEAPSTSIDYFLPQFSPEPVRYKFENETEKNDFLNYISQGISLYDTQAKTEVVKEGDYTFYIVDYGALVNGVENREDFNWNYIINNQEVGKMQKAIDYGMGIPSSIIREKCDLEGLKHFSYTTDFTLPFWDNVNFREELKCYKKGSTTDYVVLSPTLTHETSSSKEWFPTFSINGDILSPGGSLEHVDKVLSYNGFESVAETIAKGEYSPSAKGTVSYDYTI